MKTLIRFTLAVWLAFLPFAAQADTVIIGPTQVISATPTLDTSAYATGELLHATIMTLTGACRTGVGFAIVQDVTITDLAKQQVNIDALFFNSSITLGAHNAAFDPADADLAAYFQAAVTVDTHFAFNDSSASIASNAGRVVKCDSNGKLYLVLVSRGAPTYAATDLTVRVTFLQ